MSDRTSTGDSPLQKPKSNDVRDFFSFGSTDPSENHPNPFETLTPLETSKWEKIKVVFFTVTLIAPLRLALFVLISFSSSLVAGWLMRWGLSNMKSRSFLPRFVRFLGACVIRLLLFIAGFYWINTNNFDKAVFTNNKAGGPVRIIVANHTSIWDAFFLMYFCPCAVLAKRELFNVSILGRILHALCAVPVDRVNSGAGGSTTIEAIKERVENEK